MRKIAIFLSMSLILSAYDFGKIPQVRVGKIAFNKPMMVMVGKTKCIWCESMAPQLKEIKEEYPKTTIYYVNSDKDPLWTINNGIEELPVQLFYNGQGQEIGRHTGYIGKEGILELLRRYNILNK